MRSLNRELNTVTPEVLTFTPTLLFGGAATGIVYSVQSGTYAKIGNAVFINLRVATTTKSSSTGAATIGGLPFAVSGATVSCTIRCGSTVTFSGQLQAYIDTGASVVNLQQITEAGTSGNLTDANFSNISSITLSAHYSV